MILDAALMDGSNVVGRQDAEIVIVPHHLNQFFPESKLWAGLWLEGSRLRVPELKQLANPPKEVFRYESPDDLLQNRHSFFTRLDQIVKSK